MNHDWSREIAALTPFLGGKVLELRGGTRGLLQGTIPVELAPGGGHDLGAFPDGSADAIVALGAPELGSDPCAQILGYRRVLREGGTLAVATASAAPPTGLISLLHRIGGFDLQSVRVVRADQSWLVVATRSALAEIRKPLGLLGPQIAGQAAQDDAARAELHFQLGSILLQAGDPILAQACFERLLQHEPTSADGLFGLGMALCCQDRWGEARDPLQRAVEREPRNAEARRWLDLAERSVKPAAPAADPVLYPVARPAGTPVRAAGALRIGSPAGARGYGA